MNMNSYNNKLIDMTNIISTFKNGFRSFINVLGSQQMRLQSIIFWFIAIMYIGSKDFWMFAISAIIFGGIQEIVDVLKESNEK